MLSCKPAVCLSAGAAFTTIIDGKNQGMSTSELSGGARIHYIFQDIFVKSLNVSLFRLHRPRSCSF